MGEQRNYYDVTTTLFDWFGQVTQSTVEFNNLPRVLFTRQFDRRKVQNSNFVRYIPFHTNLK